jgi:Skp family chaperone for outer membrane proteins
LNEASLGAENKLRGEIIEVIGKLADQREFDLVISKQNVVIGERDIDISEEALKMLNKEVSSIKVKF